MLSESFILALRDEIREAMQLWSVEGCTVVIVQGDKHEVLALGKRDLTEPVTPKTLFALASCSKLITVLSLLRALSSRGLSIKTPIKTFFPRFKLYDKLAEAECTVEDILCHRTGLPGYDHLWNEGYHLSELPERLGLLKPTAGFREIHQYNSLLYDLGALLVEQLTGRPYVQYAKEQLFDPLGMKGAAFDPTLSDTDEDENVSAKGKLMLERASGFWKRVNLDGTEDENMMLSFGLGRMDGGVGTGKLWMNGEDAARWLKALPTIPEYAEAIKPRNIAGSAGGLEFADHTVLYGLGQRVSTHRGVLVHEHSGELPGFLSRFSRLPGHDAGFAILTNSDPGGKYLRALVKCRLIEAFAGLPRLEWLERIDRARQAANEATRQWLATPTPLETPIHIQGPTFDDRLIGRWESTGFDTWNIPLSNMMITLPRLGSLPFIPALYGQVQYLFAPVRMDTQQHCGENENENENGNGKRSMQEEEERHQNQQVQTANGERRYEACMMWISHDFSGVADGVGPMYGYPFEVVLSEDGRKMKVFGLTGVGEGLREEDWGVEFTRID
ncbi:hypothetical protein IAT40_005916 [Kwoniella sp. CBS 6097]